MADAGPAGRSPSHVGRLAWGAVAAAAITLAAAHGRDVWRDLRAAEVTRADAEAAAARGPVPAVPPVSPSNAPVVEWPTLEALDLETGAAPAALAALAGRAVRVPGFIIPFDDLVTSTREFLLVPYPGACIHMPTPPANQMVYVTMAGAPTPTYWMQPVWVEGVLAAERRESVYGAAGYAMRGLRVTRYVPPEGAPPEGAPPDGEGS